MVDGGCVERGDKGWSKVIHGIHGVIKENDVAQQQAQSIGSLSIILPLHSALHDSKQCSYNHPDTSYNING